MNRFNFGIFICIIFILISCKQEELILLENKPMFGDNGEERVMARPESVQVLPAVNCMINVIWPNLSPTIVSADVTITKVSNGESEEYEVVDFKNVSKFQANAHEPYLVTIVYINKNGLKSKPTTLNVVPRDYAVNELIENIKDAPLSGAINFIFDKSILSNFKYIIKYHDGDGEVVKEFNSSADSTDILTIDKLYDDLIGYEFSFQIEDIDLGVESNILSKRFKPLAMPHILLLRNIVGRSWFDEGTFTWNNPSGKTINIHFSYELNGQQYSRVKSSSLMSDSIVVSNLPIGSTDFKIFTSDENNLISETNTHIVTPSLHKEFKTATAKTGWRASVSSNHTGDGGGAGALIDGNPVTYWHTPWSGTPPPFPHHATISFPSLYKLTKIHLQNRDHNTPNSPGQFEVQISEDGVNFVSYQSFQVVSNARSGISSFQFTKPVITNYVRVVFKTSLSNTAFMNLAEISFDGYTQ